MTVAGSVGDRLCDTHRVRVPKVAIVLILGALAVSCDEDDAATSPTDGGTKSFACCALEPPSCHCPVGGTNKDGSCRRGPCDAVPIGWRTEIDERGCPYYVVGHTDSCLTPRPTPDAGIDQPVGTPCTIDADCGPSGLGRCSSTVFGDSKGVCVRAGCARYGTCDGERGVCIDFMDGSYCVPRCTFGDDGAPPVGCAPGRACFSTMASKAPLGIGQCQSQCATDAECATGWRCQAENGVCSTATFTSTKSVGDACTSGECWCIRGTTAGGYCSQRCRVGGEGACPAGMVCDPWLPDGFTTAPKDLAGLCGKICAADADCTALNATCVAAGGLSVKVCRPK